MGSAKPNKLPELPPVIRIPLMVVITGAAGYWVYDKFVKKKPDKTPYDLTNLSMSTDELNYYVKGLIEAMKGVFDNDDYLPYWQQIAAGKFSEDDLRYMNTYSLKHIDEENNLYNWVEWEYPMIPSFWDLKNKVLTILSQAGIFGS